MIFIKSNNIMFSVDSSSNSLIINNNYSNILNTNLDIKKIINSYDKIIFGENLPNKLKTINFGTNFNQFVDLLQESLEYIMFVSKFNKPVNNLPRELKSLIFGNAFNQPINNLPKNLIFLYLGNNFNQTLNYIPDNIKELFLGEKFSFKLTKLPKKLIEISMSSTYKYLDEFKNTYSYYFIKDNKYSQIKYVKNKNKNDLDLFK